MIRLAGETNAIIPLGDLYTFVVEGESDTMGNLLVKSVLGLYPDISACTYSIDSIVRKLTIRIRCNDDVTIVLNDSLKNIVNVFTQLMANF